MNGSTVIVNRAYRVAPTLRNSLIVAIVYAAILFLLQLSSGVSYADIAESAATLFAFVVFPVGVGAALLTGFVLYSGWWQDLWTDKYQLRRSGWIHIVTVMILLGVIASFVSGNIVTLDPLFILVAAMGLAFVGYTEEVLFRGFVRIGGRGSGYTEAKTMILVMVSFGLFHAANILTGSPIAIVFWQIINAAVLGGGLYLVFRKTGLLAIPIILHALVDFSLLTKGAVSAQDPRTALAILAIIFNVVVAVVVLIALVKMFRRGGDLEVAP